MIAFFITNSAAISAGHQGRERRGGAVRGRAVPRRQHAASRLRIQHRYAVLHRVLIGPGNGRSDWSCQENGSHVRDGPYVRFFSEYFCWSQQSTQKQDKTNNRYRSLFVCVLDVLSLCLYRRR